MSSIIEDHDNLLANMPPGATHESCFVCVAKLDNNQGGVMSTYTESDVLEAVQQATAPLKAELDALKASAEKESVEARIAEAKAEAVAEADARVEALESEHAAKLDDLQSKLDSAEALANTKTTAYDELVAYLTAEAEASAQLAEVAQRTEERREAVAALAVFTDEQIEDKLPRWVAQDDDTFASTLEDLAAIAALKNKDEQPEIGGEKKVLTAVDAARASDNEDDPREKFRALAQLSRSGVNLRNL